MSDALRKLLAAREQETAVITPHLGIMTLHFQLYGVADLKEKRKVFSPLKTQWGREADLAVAETGDLEALDSAIWSIAALGTNTQLITARLDQVEKAIAQKIDAPILEVQRELL